MVGIGRIYTNVMIAIKLAEVITEAATGKNQTFNSLQGIASSFWDGLTKPQSNYANKKYYKRPKKKF